MKSGKPRLERGCESCLHRQGDFIHDTINEEVIRCYCRARHVNVDAEVMSKDCDFWALDPNYTPENKNDKIHGI